MSLLGKLKKAAKVADKQGVETRITDADKVSCITIEEEFKKQLAIANEWKNFYENQQAICSVVCPKETLKDVYLPYRERSEFFENPFNEKVEKITQMRWGVHKFFIREVQDYFNGVYNLSIELKFTDEQVETFNTWQQVVELYLNECPVDLVQMGIENLIKQFQNKVRWSENIELKKDKVYLKLYYPWFRLSSYSWKKDEIEYDDKSPLLLKKIIGYFEQGDLENCVGLSHYILQPSTEVEYRRKYTFPEWINKVEHYQLYKNGKFELKFRSKEYALEFWRTFKVDEIQSKK